jgi:hypothetical protein
MMLSLVFREASVAALIATLVMLFEMLFGGLLLNKNSVPPWGAWLQTFSYFNCALEALVVNEVNGLTLFETKFGLQIDVSCKGLCGVDTFGHANTYKCRSLERLSCRLLVSMQGDTGRTSLGCVLCFPLSWLLGLCGFSLWSRKGANAEKRGSSFCIIIW